jgi:hypothetical protein
MKNGYIRQIMTCNRLLSYSRQRLNYSMLRYITLSNVLKNR